MEKDRKVTEFVREFLVFPDGGLYELDCSNVEHYQLTSPFGGPPIDGYELTNSQKVWLSLIIWQFLVMKRNLAKVKSEKSMFERLRAQALQVFVRSLFFYASGVQVNARTLGDEVLAQNRETMEKYLGRWHIANVTPWVDNKSLSVFIFARNGHVFAGLSPEGLAFTVDDPSLEGEKILHVRFPACSFFNERF